MAVWVCTYGVARLETSFAICHGQCLVQQRRVVGAPATHHVDTAVTRDSNDAVERPQVDAHDRHVWLAGWRGISRKFQRKGEGRGERKGRSACSVEAGRICRSWVCVGVEDGGGVWRERMVISQKRGVVVETSGSCQKQKRPC